MRVNVYAEEMTDRVEIISKEIDGHRFTGLRLYLALPGTFYRSPDGNIHPVSPHGNYGGKAMHLSAPFIHHPGDDDSAAVTFWGKRDLRDVLKKMLAALDEHYATQRPYVTCSKCGTQIPVVSGALAASAFHECAK